MAVQKTEIPKVICHRGANAYAPENTIASLRKAAELGGKWVEFDAKLTRDGQIILMHDDDLKRTTDGTGLVAETDWKDIRGLDAGSWFGEAFKGERIPTLSEVIAVLAELGLGANVEIKPCPGREEHTGKAVAALLAAEWPASLPTPLISSFREKSLEVALGVAPHIPRALLFSRIPSYWRDRARQYGCVAIHSNEKHFREDLVADLHRAGLAARVYTVNERARAETLFNQGVDGVLTDFFDRLADL